MGTHGDHDDHEHDHHHHDERDDPTGDAAAFWDSRYASGERHWSGNPNGALVDEVGSLTPGRALEVACGEGADALWLARQGWDVTAIDISTVAIERAAGAAKDAEVALKLIAADIADVPPAPASYDLVFTMYPAIPRPFDAVLDAMVAAVAPGGRLLVVHHDPDRHPARARADFDPADYLMPDDVKAALGDDWTVEVDEFRARVAPDGGHAHGHDVPDQVVRARRT